MNKLNGFFAMIPAIILKNRFITWLLFLLFIIISVIGAHYFKITQSDIVFFGKNDPVRLAYDKFRSQFGGSKGVYIVYRAKDGDVFSDASLNAIKGIQDELLNQRDNVALGKNEPLSHLVDLKTIINTSYLEIYKNTLISRKFIGNHFPQNENERDKLRKLAINNPEYILSYISKDTLYGGIIIDTDFEGLVYKDYDSTLKERLLDFKKKDSISDDEDLFSNVIFKEANIISQFDNAKQNIKVKEKVDNKPLFSEYDRLQEATFIAAIEKVINQNKYKKHLEFFLVGEPVLSKYYHDNSKVSFYIMLGALFVICIFVWFTFTSFSALLWAFTIILVSILGTIGFLGFTNAIMSDVFILIVVLIMVVGVADVVHIISGYLFFINKGQSHQGALTSVYRNSGFACVLTTLTTAIGLLSMILVPIAPIRNIGIFSAVGIFMSLAMSLFLLPAMIDLLKPISNKKINKNYYLVQKFLNKFELLSLNYPWQIIFLFVIVVLFSIYGATKIRIDTNILDDFPKDLPLRQGIELVDKMMGGSSSIEILIDTKKIDGLKNIDVLKRIDKLQSYIEKEHRLIVTKSFSLTNVIKSSFKALNDGDQEKYIIPDNSTILVQTLFMFNNVDTKTRRSIVNEDYSMGRVHIRMRTGSSKQYEEIINDIKEKINDNFFPSHDSKFAKMVITVTGSSVLTARLANYISTAQLKSFGMALSVISILLIVIFGSIRLGFLSVFPNIFPIFLLFGILGFAEIQLSAAILLIAPLVIGISVDDTIHFLTHYRKEIFHWNDKHKAIICAFRETGQAIVITSLILASGFSVLFLMPELPIAYVGLLSAIAIISALAADLFLLPALCYLFDPNIKKNISNDKINKHIFSFHSIRSK